MASKTPKLVVALDIGTTHSGYAWQYRGDFESNPSKVGLHNWHYGLTKTSTAILFSNFENKEVDSFGFDAEKRYARHGANSQNKDWRLFKFFKMVLYGDSFNVDVIVEDAQLAEHATLKCIMIEFIKALKAHFLTKSQNKGHSSIPAEDIRWVLTVPAIWEDAARNFMKQCAEAAIGPANKVLIALEPEAAAIYCLHLSEEERHEMGGLCKTGDSFLLADLGGGTADVSVQKVADDGKFEQLCVPDGDRFGGEDINNAFLLACKEEFDGSSWFSAWHNLCQNDILKVDWKMRNDFEKQKVDILREAATEDEWIVVNLPRALVKKLDDGKRPSGADSLRLKRGSKSFRIKDEEFLFKDNFFTRNIVQNDRVKYISNFRKSSQTEIRHTSSKSGFSRWP